MCTAGVLAAASAGVTMPLMFVLFGTSISPFVSSQHLVDIRAGEFVGNFSGFVNGDIHDFGEFENDLDRLWYAVRPFHVGQTTYSQAAAFTSLPSLSLVGASVLFTNSRFE